MNMNVILDKLSLTENTGNSTPKRTITLVSNNDNMATDLTPDPVYNLVIRYPMFSCICNIPIKQSAKTKTGRDAEKSIKMPSPG